MGLIVKSPGQRARPLSPADLQGEITLQDFVVENPSCLPLGELRSDLEFLVLAKEFPTESGPIDAVGLDDEGNVYLIETKIYRNPDKRRVLAQVLDYGAALWNEHGDPRTFLSKLDAATSRLVGRGLRDYSRREFRLDDEGLEKLLQSVEAIVQSGSFRFVVLMDHLDERLKSLIGFINENSRFDVYAVELELYRFDGYEAVIPRLYGAESRKEVDQPASRRIWDEGSFFEDAARRLDPEALQSLRRLYEFSSKDSDQIDWGRGLQRGSFNPKYNHINPRKSVFSVYSDGAIEFNFKWLRPDGQPLPEPVRRMAARLQQIPALSLRDGYENEYHHVPLDAWAPSVEAFIASLRETLRSAG